MAKQNGERVRLSDVAREAGVSLGTVSNTINRPDSVSERTRKKVLATIKRLDFVPNQGAAALRTGSNRLIGLVIPDITNAFYAEITKGVALAAEAQEYAVLLFNTDDRPERELHQLEILARHRSVGALIVPRKADQARLDRLRNLGMHLVLIDRATPEQVGCSVSIDDVQGGQLAASHLLDSGRTRLAFVTGPTHIPQCADRREGLHRALALAGRGDSDCVEVEVDEMASEDGDLAAQKILELPTRPDGVFCINDQLAIGLVRGLRRAGVRVPQDIAVVGYGDSPIAESATVPLTTIRQPMIQLGRAAVGHLLREVEHPSREHHHSSTVFTPSLVVRASAP